MQAGENMSLEWYFLMYILLEEVSLTVTYTELLKVSILRGCDLIKPFYTGNNTEFFSYLSS